MYTELPSCSLYGSEGVREMLLEAKVCVEDCVQMLLR